MEFGYSKEWNILEQHILIVSLDDQLLILVAVLVLAAYLFHR